MRVLIDHSCLEIYLSSGEVLSTRVYRGQQPADSDAGIDFVAFGGSARVEVIVLASRGTGSMAGVCNLLRGCLAAKSAYASHSTV